MKRILGVSPTSLMLRVALYDSSSTTGGILTGLVFNTAGLAIAIAKDASAGADVLTNEDITTIGTYQAPTSSAHVRFKAVDATDMTGVYELHFHNDTVASISGFILKISGATNLAPCFLEVQLSNLAANVTQISGSAVSTTTAQLGVNVVQMSGSAPAADNIELAGVNYSATRGLSGTALPAAAAAAAGGLPVSTAGGLDLDAKLAATNEVTAARMGALTDWINGGRLDLILDAVKAQTDNLPPGIKKNTELANFEFVMTDSTNHAPAAGLTVTATRSIDGGAFAACANAVSAVASGVYKITLAAADLNGSVVTLRFTAALADDRLITIKTSV